MHRELASPDRALSVTAQQALIPQERLRLVRVGHLLKARLSELVLHTPPVHPPAAFDVDALPGSLRGKIPACSSAS